MADNDSDRTISTGGRSNVSGGNLAPRKPDPLLNTVFADRYTILEVLGKGGMGVVYKARHDLMDRLVAIKMMLPQFVSDDVSLARFQREARAASKINHQNVISIHDFGITPDTGVAYLVMDYVEGETLAAAIKRDGQLGVGRAVKIFLQVCDALITAHQQGIIHRDLKPGNIMLVTQQDKQKDSVKVLDFGVAKLAAAENETDQQRLTTTGEIFGSPVYMSPEQCSGATLDARSDIYALGCVIYETLTGKAPCIGKNALETISRHITMMPASFSEARPDLHIPESIEEIVFRALQKDPDKRQQSMQQLYDELSVGMPGMSASAISQPDLRRQSLTGRETAGLKTTVRMADQSAATANNRALPVVAACIGALVIAGGALAWFMQSHASPGPKAAVQVTPVTTTTEHHGSGVRKPAVQAPSVTTSTDTKPSTPATDTDTKESPAATTTTVTASYGVETKGNSPLPAKLTAKILAKITAKHVTKLKVNKVVDDVAPAPVKHHHDSDYYDYAVRHENEGSPAQLPGKLFGNE
ncbi:MAG TPA: serine/threonine-protein kinase [Candidatus Obscuribacterales bacterium]